MASYFGGRNLLFFTFIQGICRKIRIVWPYFSSETVMNISAYMRYCHVDT